MFHGWVQGVGFRYRASHAAALCGVTGWVKNEYDGSVSCEVQGRECDIDAWQLFIEQARFIVVEKVVKKEIPEVAEERSFGVKY